MTDANYRDVLHMLAEMTVKLTEIRWRGCNHLAVENFSPELYDSLICVAKKHGLLKNGKAYAGHAGGYARAEKLSPERRQEIAKAAASKRWGGDK